MNTYTLPIPNQLNGEQLQKEIGALSVRVIGDNLIIDCDKSQSEVESAVAAHVPLPTVQPTITEKLAFVGLSIDDLKAALGL
jgi:hypothetical protein